LKDYFLVLFNVCTFYRQKARSANFQLLRDLTAIIFLLLYSTPIPVRNSGCFKANISIRIVGGVTEMRNEHKISVQDNRLNRQPDSLGLNMGEY